MFEIKIEITTPEEPVEWDCNDTRCLTEKGKRDCCRHCPIMLLEKKHLQELENAKERVKNMLYVEHNVDCGYLLKIPDIKPVMKQVDNIFDEKPIKELR